MTTGNASMDLLRRNLEYSIGPQMLSLLHDPSVIEIMLNPDSKLWIEKYGQDHEHVGEILPEKARLILTQVAGALDILLSASHPAVEGEFPLDGSRFEGIMPPVAGGIGPAFALRKKASRVFTLPEYLAAGSITSKVVTIIEDAVCRHKNIVVVGGTSSGKTTFVNAVIEAIARLTPHDRVLVLEDTAELQCTSPNRVMLHTSDIASVDMRKLAKVCMRLAPRRILVGEVRDAAALEMLKLWNTGHPGGVATYHADSATEALERLEELVEEAGVGPKQALIGRALDMIVYMEKTKDNRRVVSHILEIKRFSKKEDCYETETLYALAS